MNQLGITFESSGTKQKTDKTMKKLLLFIFLGGLLINANAQPPKYDDLVILFADGNYEKLLKKAEKYTLSDKTRKDAIPYLYLSKANYEISKGGELAEKYPRALKDALKYAGKCAQKDKEGTVVAEHIGFYTKLKETLIEDIRNFVDAGEWARLSGKTPLMQKVDKEDIGIHYLSAAIAYHKKDRKTMTTEAEKANEMLKNSEPSKFVINDEEDDADLIAKKKADLAMLKIGVFAYADVLILARQEPKAKELMGSVAQWYEKDNEFKAKYDEIVN